MISQTIKQRLLVSLLPPPAAAAALLEAPDLSARLQPDGSWPGVTGSDPGAAVFAEGPPAHLQRTLTLAQAARAGADGSIGNAMRRAFDFWLAHDFQSAEWRQNQLVVPRLVGSIALLADGALSAGARGKVTEILARSRWQHWVAPTGWADWTGITLLHVAQNVVLRGCVGDAPSLFEEAFTRVFRAFNQVAGGEEGIWPDMIYHSDQTETSDGRPGLVYATECARFVALAHGTQWQAPAEALKLLADFLLDGQQWLLRNGMIASGSSATGNHQDADTLDELAAVVRRLAQLGDAPRQAELATLARRLVGQGETLSGHRHFWRARFSVHQRPAFFASVLLPSAVPTAHDGATRVLRSGHEYDWGVFGAPTEGWPGTTFVGSNGGGGEVAAAANDELLAGGVSEGDYGLAAMKTERPGLQATKAWFYFDHCFVGLGAGISAAGSNQTVFTSVNQCRLNGPVLAAADFAKARTLTPGSDHVLPMIRRVNHDGIAYHFTSPARVTVQAGCARSGPEMVPADGERFALTLNHGLNPRNESYGYITLPLGDDTEAKAKIEEEVAQIEILANTPTLQAVRHRGLKLVGVVFWLPGVAALPDKGRVAANQPCVLLCRDTPSTGRRLTIANLRGEATTVHIEYANRCLCFELPGGADARRGVSRSL